MSHQITFKGGPEDGRVLMVDEIKDCIIVIELPKPQCKANSFDPVGPVQEIAHYYRLNAIASETTGGRMYEYTGSQP